MNASDEWARYPDTRDVISAYGGRCASCRARFEIGDTIVGSQRDGWVCKACGDKVEVGRRQLEWAVPAGTTGRKTRIAWPCCHCGVWLPAGSLMWENIAGGSSCENCRQTVPPTWGGVVMKVLSRIEVGKPISLAHEDYTTVARTVGSQDTIKPDRRGGNQAWAPFRREHVGPYSSMSAEAAASGVYGLILDSLEFGFTPNVQTNAFLALARRVEDPEFRDPRWDEIFTRRAIEFS